MADYTLHTDDLDEAALTRYVTNDINPGRIARGQEPYADNAAFLAARFRDLIAPVLALYNDADIEPIIAAYRAERDLKVRAAVKAALEKDQG